MDCIIRGKDCSTLVLFLILKCVSFFFFWWLGGFKKKKKKKRTGTDASLWLSQVNYYILCYSEDL